MGDSRAYHVPATLNEDFSQRVVVDTNELPWLPSPQAGVERRLLDRIGTEVARATSIVRYAEKSQFPTHVHGAGEEFLVLEGTFCDEHGVYPVGTYVRNPPGSSHAPFTDVGCVILVKLRQMRASGEPHVVCDTNKLKWQNNDFAGYQTKTLFDAEADTERVTLERLSSGTTIPTSAHQGGEELLVIEGELIEGERQYGTGTWIRIPDGQHPIWRTESGCTYWRKQGHLLP